MKTIQPEQFAYNIIEWDTAMESARINIELKAPGQYSIQQYTQDYLDAALLTPCKSFKREVSSYRTKWMLGGEVHLTIDYLRDNITQMYVNFEDDETWKHEIAESSQVIALATQMQKLQNDMKSTIALATAASAAKSGTSNNDAAPSHRGKRQPYTVKEWRLKFVGEGKEFNGKTCYWCKGDHYSGGNCTMECMPLTKHVIMTNGERSRTKEMPKSILANAQQLHLHPTLNPRPRSSHFLTSFALH